MGEGPGDPGAAVGAGERGSVASVGIGRERETDRGWCYEAVVRWRAGGVSTLVLTLSWSDHDLLSRGALPPSRVAEGVCRAAAARLGEKLPERLDASQVARLVGDLSEWIGAEP